MRKREGEAGRQHLVLRPESQISISSHTSSAFFNMEHIYNLSFMSFLLLKNIGQLLYRISLNLVLSGVMLITPCFFMIRFGVCISQGNTTEVMVILLGASYQKAQHVICPNTGDVTLTKVMLNRFIHYKITTLPFIIN